jgi:hypothetical protein
MAEVKPPRPRNVLVAEFPGLSKDDASQALRDADGDLNKARKLVKKRRGDDVSDSDDDVVIGDTIQSDAALARQLQAELNGEGQKRSRDAQDLTADSDDEPAAKKAKAPPWQGKRGTARMFAEMSALRKWKGSPRVFDIEMVQDRADKWRFSGNGFDNDCSAGRNLNADLRKLRGQSCIKMEITFPSDYPTRPFFLRCVSPRFCWYTGHVTAGGAICIEALTTEGTPGSWQPDICVESVLNTVFMNFLDTTSEIIRTATGPGGRSGPLRVDLKGNFHPSPLQEYSEHEARSAFTRMLQHHRTNGW